MTDTQIEQALADRKARAFTFVELLFAIVIAILVGSVAGIIYLDLGLRQ